MTSVIHAVLFFGWLVMLPVAFCTGWIFLVAFVAASSIYANAGLHWAAWQGARGELRQMRAERDRDV